MRNWTNYHIRELQCVLFKGLTTTAKVIVQQRHGKRIRRYAPISSSIVITHIDLNDKIETIQIYVLTEAAEEGNWTLYIINFRNNW